MTSRLLTRKRATIADGMAMMDQSANVGERNRAVLAGTPTIHTPSAATITAFMGARLVARASGIFLVSVSAQYVAAAGDGVTWQITSYTDAVAGTPLTLPANAVATGLNCFVDNSGAGIAPSAGATVGSSVYAPTHVIGTTAVDDIFSWSGLVGASVAGSGALVAVPFGESFYVTLSVTNSVATRAIGTANMNAYELA